MLKSLAQLWIDKLEDIVPLSNPRLKIKLAWHLAALGVDSNEKLAGLPDDALKPQARQSQSLIALRSQYLAALEASAPAFRSRSPMV